MEAVSSFIKFVKFGIQLPKWYERRLRLWAAVKGVPRATLAANIVQARIEANWDQVQKDLEAIAQEEGITREELEARFLPPEEDDQPPAN